MSLHEFLDAVPDGFETHLDEDKGYLVVTLTRDTHLSVNRSGHATEVESPRNFVVYDFGFIEPDELPEVLEAAVEG